MSSKEINRALPEPPSHKDGLHCWLAPSSWALGKDRQVIVWKAELGRGTKHIFTCNILAKSLQLE